MKKQYKVAVIGAAIVFVALVCVAFVWVCHATHAEITPITDIEDVSFKTISALAVLIGGVWAFYKYILAGSASWICNISLDTSIFRTERTFDCW
ncbi:hypothetical protein PTKU64_84360 [Paraburkholderia terrae]|uniref:Uncharacterized protein n=1 Tax=Paraburkholderia terrae TaxID=311230 RepID=A0ABN6JUV8_9BURK|nr:hypothetical protein [Paraburkholderia terrae]BCZ84761.1 hypothetical protein PTKU64_84360 [Paraburkholderia terrae]